MQPQFCALTARLMPEQVHHYQLKTLQEIFDLSQSLAHYFPEPEQVMTGIYELLLNAVEHGNLGIGCAAKTQLIKDGKWEAEIMHRLSLPHYAAKHVEITLRHDDKECRLTICDQGEGFAWREYLAREANPRDLHGRGLLIAFNAGFDHIAFNEAGNIVTCTIAGLPSIAFPGYPYHARTYLR